MKTLRAALTSFGILLLLAGYLAAMQQAMSGAASEYAAKVDSPPIRMLALFMLVSALVLSQVPVPEEDA